MSSANAAQSGFFHRCWQLIKLSLQSAPAESRVVSPEDQPKVDAYYQFHQRLSSQWEIEKEALLKQLQEFRSVSRAARKSLMATAEGQSNQKFLQLSNQRPIGFHFNESGGYPEDFVIEGGIWATHGDRMFDIAASMSKVPPPPNPAPPTVFYYDSRVNNLAQILARRAGYNQGKRQLPICVILFDLEAVKNLPGVETHSAMRGHALAFPVRPGQVGIPSERFYLPPISFESEIRTRLGLNKLNSEEASFLTLLWLQSALDSLSSFEAQ